MNDDPNLIGKSTMGFRRDPSATPKESIPRVRVTELPSPGASISQAAANPQPSNPGPLSTQVFLPSRFEFYEDLDTCFVRPMTGLHQSKFNRAAQEKKDRHTVNAITHMIGYDAGNLTIPDFFFLLYYIRLNSYTKTTLVHRGVCTNEEHHRDVQEKRKPATSLNSVHTINRTWLEDEQLSENYLEGFETSINEVSSILDTLGMKLDVPRMKDTIDLNDDLLSDPANADSLSELQFIGDRAACVRFINDPNASLRSRIQAIENLPVDVHDMLDEWRLRVSLYGVKEVIRFKCPECGADVENPVLLSAHSFL